MPTGVPMGTAAQVLAAFVALEHVGFLVMEMFLWRHPAVRKIFKSTPEFAEATKVLAANQGLYNGFLVAGLVWSFTIADPGHAFATRVFFLSCVIVAGVFGGFTAKMSILLVQGVPAAVALGLTLAARS
jgi:putative membrane protein